MCDVLGNKCYEQRMLTAQIDYKNDCDCFTGCNDIRYIPVLDGRAEGPEEVSKPDMLKLFRIGSESPADWNNHSFLQSGSRDKFLTRYVLGYFHGKSLF